MSKYGSLYQVSDYIERLLPKRGSGPFSALFAHHAIMFLKTLDRIQAENPAFTLSVHTGDAIWIGYEGRRLCFVLPTQRHLRVGVPVSNGGMPNKLGKALDSAAKVNDGVKLFGDRDGEWTQWHVETKGLKVIEEFFDKLPRSNSNSLDVGAHPRQFPGYARQAALEEFERGGRMCPGVEARGQKRHKLLKNERIEFDHILPWKSGGSNLMRNIQVLCVRCNSLKRATAL